MKKKIQAKHLPERAILEHLAKRRSEGGYICTHWDCEEVGGGDPEDSWYLRNAAPELAKVPEKVLLAKLRALAKRGLVSGCDCGCRGDWEITPEGLAHLRRHPLRYPEGHGLSDVRGERGTGVVLGADALGAVWGVQGDGEG